MTSPPAPASDPAPDVLVVGAGLAGLPVAWELVRRGATVRIVDRATPGQATSRVAAGMLAPVTEAEPDDPDHLLLGTAAVERWPAFAAGLEDASGIAVPLHRRGTLALARDRDEAEALDRFARVCTGFGVAVERLLPSAARRLEPALAPTLRGALSVPGDAAVDPRRVVEALVAALGAAGVATTVGDVARVTLDGGDAIGSGSRATGVGLADGTELRAGEVVLATGAWGLEGLPAAARVPVRPVKGQLLVLRDPSGPGLVERVLRFGTGYVVPRDDGRYVLGATTEEQGFDTQVTAWALHDLLRDGAELVPGLLDLAVEETLAGLRPTTPDGLPAIGAAPGVGGLWWATGHHRNGVLLASLTGALLADALTGADTTVGTDATVRADALTGADAPRDDLATLVDPARFTRTTNEHDDGDPPWLSW
ncbi:glycine oxidase ThiO [Patulibacter americanus]|uniref:glycine oxidase ThiO n=1 Tax=Patulibacter americanus TaxID=588672 RepID=UPI0009FC657B|nr:glycine oxidase ThiO [Patulibacter americanus]